MHDMNTQRWIGGFCSESLRLRSWTIGASLQKGKKFHPEASSRQTSLCSFKFIHEKHILVHENSHMHFNGILTHRRIQGLSLSHFSVFLAERPKGRSKHTMWQTHHVTPVLSLKGGWKNISLYFSKCNAAVILQAADMLITAIEE